MAMRISAIIIVFVIAVGASGLLLRFRRDLGLEGPSPTIGAPSASPSATASATATASGRPTDVTVNFCGRVTRYASDGAQMLISLESGSTSEQFSLQYQMARTPPPRDIGDRLAAGETQLLHIDGLKRPSDSGAPLAIALQDYVVQHVSACP
jgi:hypothetical protein